MKAVVFVQHQADGSALCTSTVDSGQHFSWSMTPDTDARLEREIARRFADAFPDVNRSTAACVLLVHAGMVIDGWEFYAFSDEGHPLYATEFFIASDLRVQEWRSCFKCGQRFAGMGVHVFYTAGLGTGLGAASPDMMCVDCGSNGGNVIAYFAYDEFRSNGTVNTKHLVDTFTPAAANLAPEAMREAVDATIELDPDERDQTLWIEMFELLEMFAPFGYWFGTNPHDPAEVGFWRGRRPQE